jgi:hypothetical protein
MKRIIGLGIFIGLVIAVWTGAWFWAAGQITGYAKSLETADGVDTPRLTCGSFGVSGWPFAFDVTCMEASVTLDDTTLDINGLKATAQVYNPFHLLVFAQSPVAIEDAFTGSQSRLDFDSASLSARVTGWRIGRVSLVVDKPVWNDTVLDDRLIGKAGHLEAHLIDLPDLHDKEAGLAGLGQYVKIDDLAAPGFGIAGGTATFEGEVTKLSDDLRTYGDAGLLQRWQAAGGQFVLRGFKGEDSAGDNFAATGNLSLDTQGRLNGQMKLTSKGIVEQLGPVIPETYRGLVLGAPAADGSYSQTVNIAAGVVFAGVVPAGVIPPLY